MGMIERGRRSVYRTAREPPHILQRWPDRTMQLVEPKIGSMESVTLVNVDGDANERAINFDGV